MTQDKEEFGLVPTYEYNCSGCGATMERWQRFDETALTLCPSCGGSLRRVYQPVGVIFKGRGWYCTDSKTRSKPESNGGECGNSSCKAACPAASKEAV